ncbi:MAG: hypothetical protein RLO51_16175 [Thalassobaculum sp.]|uniref:hypothetical protein n=1 Tax=Thalassobaculum sp. TaxID=2022740 RepID=UPI0032ED9A20
MPDDQFRPPPEAFLLDPPVGVPEPAPLDMPRRRIRRFPLDLSRLLPRPVALATDPHDQRAG